MPAAQFQDAAVKKDGVRILHKQRQVGLKIQHIRIHGGFFGGQHIRRIRHPHIPFTRNSGIGFQQIGFEPVHIKTEIFSVFTGHLKRTHTHIQSGNHGPVSFLAKRQCYATAARAKIQQGFVLLFLRFQHPVHQLFGFGTGNQNRCIHL